MHTHTPCPGSVVGVVVATGPCGAAAVHCSGSLTLWPADQAGSLRDAKRVLNPELVFRGSSVPSASAVSRFSLLTGKLKPLFDSVVIRSLSVTVVARCGDKLAENGGKRNSKRWHINTAAN